MVGGNNHQRPSSSSSASSKMPLPRRKTAPAFHNPYKKKTAAAATATTTTTATTATTAPRSHARNNSKPHDLPQPHKRPAAAKSHILVLSQKEKENNVNESTLGRSNNARMKRAHDDADANADCNMHNNDGNKFHAGDDDNDHYYVPRSPSKSPRLSLRHEFSQEANPAAAVAPNAARLSLSPPSSQSQPHSSKAADMKRGNGHDEMTKSRYHSRSHPKAAKARIKSKNKSKTHLQMQVDVQVQAQAPPESKKFRLKKLSDVKLTRTNDEVHNTIDFCPVMKALVDTPQFQRLRRVQQLGLTSLVYACANHTRFEHSLGVAHLARQVASRIQSRQPNLQTTDKDVLCVTLAGLLHDIGHGPFSHVYEAFRAHVNAKLKVKDNHRMRQEYARFDDIPDGWTHEQASLMMIDAALAELGMEIDYRPEALDLPLRQIGDGVDVMSMKVFGRSNTLSSSGNGLDPNILTSRDWIFVKECIVGGPIPQVKERMGIDERIGRVVPHKEWLYDIVANKHSGLDVDKLEYFARDKRRAYADSGNVDTPMITDVIVAKAHCSDSKCAKCNSITRDNRQGFHFMICYPSKHVKSALRVFRERFDLHETVYQHKTTNAASAMMVDILTHADTHFLINGLPISRACADPKAYLKLDDSITSLIAFDSNPALKPAQDLLFRLDRHDIYKRAGERVIDMDDPLDKELWSMPKHEIIESLLKVSGRHGNGNDDGTTCIELDKDDIIIDHASMHYGNKDKSPLDLLRFVSSKCNLDPHASLDQLPLAECANEKDFRTIIPRIHMKRVLRIYCRTPEKRDLLTHVFEDWERQLEENVSLNHEKLPPAAAGVGGAANANSSMNAASMPGRRQGHPKRADDYDDDMHHNGTDDRARVAMHITPAAPPPEHDDRDANPCTQESDNEDFDYDMYESGGGGGGGGTITTQSPFKTQQSYADDVNAYSNNRTPTKSMERAPPIYQDQSPIPVSSPKFHVHDH